MSDDQGARLWVSRADLRQTRVVADPDAPTARPLADGEARLRIQRFALTANNITYAAFGEAMHYWDFFPTGDAAWGCIPVWGFAEVTESRAQGVAVGERYYGYWPMGRWLVLQPQRAGARGFVAGDAHRRALPAVYNQALRCAADPSYVAAREAEQALLKPLFTTSFLIDDFLADAGYFGGRQVIFSSASAKTAYAAAQLLKARGDVKVVGLTSPSNVGFTKSLGFYDEVLPYDAIGGMDASAPSVFVDIAGNAAVRAAVHARFADNLTYSCAVGATHWDAPRPDQALAGPAPKMFFAPDVVKKRLADWGPAGFQQRLGAAWAAFVPTAARTTRVVESRGLEAAGRVFSDLASGRADPKDGHVVKMG